MEQYIIRKEPADHRWMAWIAAILLIFNVYHHMLVRIALYYSAATTALLQGIAVGLLVLFLVKDQKLKLLNVQIQPLDWMAFLTFAVILLTVRDYSGSLTYILRYGVLVVIILLMKYSDHLPGVFFYTILAAGLFHLAATLWFSVDTDFYLQHIYPHFDAQQRAHLYAQVMHNHYAVGLASHYSQNGIYISVALCSAFALAFGDLKKGWRVLTLLAIGIAFLALLMTGKRGALVFSVFAMVGTYVLCAKGAVIRRILMALLALAILFSCAYGLSLCVESVGAGFQRFLSMFTDGNTLEELSNGRFKLYKIAWDLFLEHPILGIGWREFTKEAAPYFGQDAALRDVHNVFLQLLCETGMVGGCAFVALFAAAFGMSVYCIRKAAGGQWQLSRHTKTALVFSLCYQLFFLSYCMTGNPLYDLETVYVYLLSLGISGSVYFQKRQMPEEERQSKYIKWPRRREI